MELNRPSFVLYLLVLWKGLSDSFNINVKEARIFKGPKKSQFGYKVLQHEVDGQKWLLVSAPRDGIAKSKNGDIYRCHISNRRSSNCMKINSGEAALKNISDDMKNMHFGMTLNRNSQGFLVCAPLWSQQCGSSIYNTGICTNISSDFQPSGIIAPTAQDCGVSMDIVILLDGSNSIYPWHEVQKFLSNVLNKFHIGPKQIQIGVLQYAETVVHEFSLSEHKTAREVVEAARNISRQGGRETKTAMAVRAACSEAFSPERGGRDGATKVMVVVTDGESHDGLELRDALAECEKRNISRYAIAVLGHYIRRRKDTETFIKEIKFIASDPDEKHFFNVSDEAALNDIVDALGDRIFGLEGTIQQNESSFELEMSQAGFSAHVLEDGILLGAVGAYDWNGAVVKESAQGKVITSREALSQEFPKALKNHAAYLGYTVSSVRQRNGQRVYVAGAPRFKHKGKVILFNLDKGGNLTIHQSLIGEQIGSYFGSEVCPVDVNGDSVTDVLLVAAPMYLGAGSKETGKVYIYRVQEFSLSFSDTLRVSTKPQDSRFGFTLIAVPDLNYDRFNDVVVGAPLEDGHRGAVYIYHGHQDTILPTYKQRIAASAVDPGLRYFGRSADGQMDVDGDGLIDVAVGAFGKAVVFGILRVVQVNVSVEFSPASINMLQRNCQRNGKDVTCVTATVCFMARAKSPGLINSTLDLHYNVVLDEKKFAPRALFDGDDQRQTQNVTHILIDGQMCHKLQFHVIDTADYIRPIGFLLLFSLDEQPLGPVLDDGCMTTVRSWIPFFKDCGDDDECLTDLTLQAHLDISGSRQSPYIVRNSRQRVSAIVKLENRRENAYNTSLNITFSKNLLFSSLLVKGDTQNKVECLVYSAHHRICNVSFPVFRSLMQVSFRVEFEFHCSLLLDEVELYLNVTSDSTEMNETLHDNTVYIWAAVRYESDLLLTSESSLQRYEVQPVTESVLEEIHPEFKYIFKIKNLGCFPAEDLEAKIYIPTMTSAYYHISAVTTAFTKPVTGINCSMDNATDPLRGNQDIATHLLPRDLRHVDRLDCSNSWCNTLTCHMKTLDRNEEMALHVGYMLYGKFFRTAKFKSLKIVTTFTLDVRTPQVLTVTETARYREVTLELIKPVVIAVSLWIIIGSTLGGLLLLALIVFILWKCGFFKRKRKEEESENKEDDEKRE
ncbi:integrin alpha-10 [Carcharodon carcharias]|uniref:integrin alpha-10 n=1 Tax=Carcharodon carcharias TaxID=13397 RepID=UPI001B7EC5FE|nr:integrin alpha-10 [Carcharodon carcharias]